LIACSGAERPTVLAHFFDEDDAGAEPLDESEDFAESPEEDLEPSLEPLDDEDDESELESLDDESELESLDEESEDFDSVEPGSPLPSRSFFEPALP